MPGASSAEEDEPPLPWPELQFELPDALVARYPPERRSDARLLVVPRDGSPLVHGSFRDLTRYLRPGDLLVVNDSRVMAARVHARRRSGGQVELLFLEPGPGPIRVLARPARKLRAGEVLTVAGPPGCGDRWRPPSDADPATVEVLAESGGGEFLVRTDPEPAVLMTRCGQVPLPPYLGRDPDPADELRYQTLFARALGSAAAPTAGLHFDAEVLAALERAGIGLVSVTLHVGLGTFLPLRAEHHRSGLLHEERYDVPAATAEAIGRTRRKGGRIIAVGTTSARTLEAATPPGATEPVAGTGTTRLFIRPPYTFRALDGLVTNFHLPGSSLLLLVAALLTPARLASVYREAIERRYRFYSYGDATLIV